MITQWIPAYSTHGDGMRCTSAASTSVGVSHFALTNPECIDVDGRLRRLMVTAFYPASANQTRGSSQLERAHLVDILEPCLEKAIETLTRDAMPEERAELESFLPKLTLRALRDVELASDIDAFPLLICYPGGEASRLSNAALCEQLAAEGYIVACLDAPRDAPVVVYPDREIAVPPMAKNESYINPRVADVRLLIDDLTAANMPHALSGRIDPTRIAMFGHSRGGYLSNICAVEDSRIRAAANIDGFLWGFWAKGTGINRYPKEFRDRARNLKTPILRIRSEETSEKSAKERFDLESADFGGRFTLVALNGFSHGSYGATHYITVKPRSAIETYANREQRLSYVPVFVELLGAFFSAAFDPAADIRVEYPTVNGYLLSRAA